MSRLEDALYSYLSGYAGLTALVDKRIYPFLAPQGVSAPYCVYSKIGNQRQYSHDGYSTLQRPRVQISCFAATYVTAHAIAEQIVAAMEAWPDTNADVQVVFEENEIDDYEPDTKLHHAAVDFFIWYGV